MIQLSITKIQLRTWSHRVNSFVEKRLFNVKKKKKKKRRVKNILTDSHRLQHFDVAAKFIKYERKIIEDRMLKFVLIYTTRTVVRTIENTVNSIKSWFVRRGNFEGRRGEGQYVCWTCVQTVESNLHDRQRVTINLTRARSNTNAPHYSSVLQTRGIVNWNIHI